MTIGFHRRKGPADLLILLALVAFAVVGMRTITRSDFWRHLAVGRLIAAEGIPRTDVFSFTRAGQAWVDTSWLYDRLLFSLWQAGGAPAVVTAHVALLAAAMGLTVLVARRLASPGSVALALVFAAWMIAPVFEVGPAVPSLFLVAVVVWAASSCWSPWRRGILLGAVQVLWTNIHRGFLLGPAVCLFFAAEAGVRGFRSRDRDMLRRGGALATTAVVMLALTLVNPYGLRMPGAALSGIFDPAKMFALSWISPFSGQFHWPVPRWLVTGSLLLMAAGLFGYQKRLPGALTALCVVSAFAAIRSMIYVNYYCVLALPFWAASLQTVGDLAGARMSEGFRRRLVILPGRVLLVGIALATMSYFARGRYYVSSGSAARFGLGVETDLWPSAAAEVLAEAAFPERAVNIAADGDYLMWALPGRKVFTDTRTLLYGRGFYEELHGPVLMGEESERQRIVGRWGTDVIILNTCRRYSSMALRNLLAGGHWLLVYFDGSTAILLSASEQAQRMVSNEMQISGLRLLDQARAEYSRRLSSGGARRNPPRLIGAAQVLMSMAQYEEAAQLYDMLTRGSPRFAAGWSNLGICYVHLGHAREALRALQRAVRLRPKNFIAWLWMSRAAAMAGEEGMARRAYRRAYRLDSAAAVAFGNPLAGDTNRNAGVRSDAGPQAAGNAR
ncbi:MAG TPA: tetratricopeptide repeat protein [Kiritimatiellae bacterium]|nr:tetratricopeptide repeat protein [Kiritimatiellia bacterium]